MTGAPVAATASRLAPRDALTIVGATLALAVAVWLAPASNHIVSWPRLAHRVAVFAPLYVLMRLLVLALVASGAALAAEYRQPAGERRLASVLAPLNLLWVWTLPYLPWLGDRFPLVLVLAGPVRWLFAGLAVIAVVMRLPGTIWGRVRVAAAWRALGPRAVLVVSAVLYLGLGLRSLASIGLGGDEPHYLVITHSLLADGDLQIENNHAQGHYRTFFGGTLRPDYLQRGQNGAIYSIHAPGLSAILLPGYALAGAKGAVATVAILGALAATAVFMVASHIAGAAVAWLVWAAICLTVPLVPHAWALYPEVAGTTLVAWALVWWLRPPSARAIVWGARGLCLGALPWLHTKFSVLLAGLGLMLVARLWSTRRHAVALTLPIALSGLAWLWFFYVIYGSLNPEAPYGGYAAQFVRLGNLPRSLLGQFFDQKFGLLAYAPVYGFLVAGLWAGRREPRLIVPCALALVYVVSSARLYMWWGGSSAPARFLVPVLPLVAPALARAASSLSHPVRAAGLALCVVLSLAISVSGLADAREALLFSPPHGVARLVQRVQGSAPLMSALPTFTEENWVRPATALLPWLGAVLVGGLACRALSRSTADAASGAAVGLAAFVVAGALMVFSFPAAVRGESAARGAQALLQAFDPVGFRTFDYAKLARLSPAEWLSRATIVTDRQAGTEADPLGRLTDALVLPAGQYDVRVWFEGGRARSGTLEAIVHRGLPVSHLIGPLTNPASWTVDLPIAPPALWIKLADKESASAVRRVEIAPRAVFLDAPLARADVRAVEPLTRPNAYLAYADDLTFPETGVFWTRGTGRGSVYVVPAGADTMTLILHVGPFDTHVSLGVGEQTQVLALKAEETRSVQVPLPPGLRTVRLSVAADTAFVPARVDPSSTDTRSLGCQVRILVE